MLATAVALATVIGPATAARSTAAPIKVEETGIVTKVSVRLHTVWAQLDRTCTGGCETSNHPVHSRSDAALVLGSGSHVLAMGSPHQLKSSAHLAAIKPGMNIVFKGTRLSAKHYTVLRIEAFGDWMPWQFLPGHITGKARPLGAGFSILVDGQDLWTDSMVKVSLNTKPASMPSLPVGARVGVYLFGNFAYRILATTKKG